MLPRWEIVGKPEEASTAVQSMSQILFIVDYKFKKELLYTQIQFCNCGLKGKIRAIHIYAPLGSENAGKDTIIQILLP
jgi:hypothetical protein